MPSYRDWITKIDIDVDYYSAFIKAWIAFNSWYSSEYPRETDRAVIEKIKGETNRFKTYITNFLQGTDTESSQFQNSIGNLHVALAGASIVTQERGGVQTQISFSNIALKNPTSIINVNYRKSHYRIERTGQKIKTTITNRDTGSPVFFCEQEVYNLDELELISDFIRNLTSEQKSQCRANYKLMCPYITESVLHSGTAAKIYGGVEFVPDVDKIGRGIIEVLYLLGCSLMHGELYPDVNASEVYKYAYFVLAATLKKLL